MYQIGDLILYSSTGVCEVTDIKTLEVAGAEQDRLYYILRPLYQECIISTPVEQSKVFMRPIISRQEAERLIDRIPSIRAKAYHSRVLHQLAEHYEASFKSHDCAALIELTMSIYEKKQGLLQQKRKCSVLDDRFLKRAEDLLFGELSAALDIPVDHVSTYIAQRVQALNQEGSGNAHECVQ